MEDEIEWLERVSPENAAKFKCTSLFIQSTPLSIVIDRERHEPRWQREWSIREMGRETEDRADTRRIGCRWEWVVIPIPQVIDVG